MTTDPLVAAIREARHQISAEFNHDPRRLVAYYLERQRKLKAAGKHRFVEAPTPAPEQSVLNDKPHKD
jgi:hypothetical protein